MKNNFFKLLRTYGALSLSLILLVVVFLINKKNNGLKEAVNTEKLQSEKLLSYNDSLERIIEYSNTKSLADEFFIKKEFDSAMFYYNTIAHDLNSREILQERKNLIELFLNEESQFAELGRLTKSQSALMKNLKVLRDSLVLIQDDYQEKLKITNSRSKNLEQQINKTKTELEEISGRYNELKQNRNMISFRSATGNKVNYIGDIESNRANGYGIGFWDTGGVYKGEWRNNRRSGKGRYEWADGEWYDGEFSNDQRHGYGVYFKRNGERYEGMWKENKRHGEGIVYDKNEEIINQGIWSEDNYVSKTVVVNNK